MRTTVSTCRIFLCGARRRTAGTLLLLQTTVVVLTTLWISAASAQPGGPFLPGAAGAGDPYFPLDGNGGYDVHNYDLALKYDPATDVLEGTAKIRAKADEEKATLVGQAKAHAEEVLGQAESEAEQAYRVMAEEPRLAIFLRKLDALEQLLGRRTVLVFGPDDAPFDLLRGVAPVESRSR